MLDLELLFPNDENNIIKTIGTGNKQPVMTSNNCIIYSFVMTSNPMN